METLISNQFIDYVESWSNVIHINGQWFIARDVAWTVRTMHQEGWEIILVGLPILQPDDTILQEFSVCE